MKLEQAMYQETFELELESAFNRAKRTLIQKAKVYALPSDRLANFKAAGGAQGINPVEALVGMMSKHYVSVAQMAKDPKRYNLTQWNEKLGDLRNYVLLCEALIRDIGVE
jgi:hypothetical protein